MHHETRTTFNATGTGMNSRTLYATGLLLAAGVAAFGAQPAAAQIGVAVGANFDRIGDIEGDTDATIENATGFHVGVFYDFALGPVGIRPGLFYMDIGEFQVEGQRQVPSDFQREDFDFNLFQVPIDLRLRMSTPVVTPYVSAGPVLNFVNTDDDELKESLNEFSVAGNVGVGLELGFPGMPVRFYPEFRYGFGVSRIVDDFEFLGAEFRAQEGENLSTFMLRLGVSF
jgi:hypothetical protein